MFGGDNGYYAVVDACCGSGTASVAALSLGFCAIAFDNDSKQRDGFKSRLMDQMKKMAAVIRKAESNKDKASGNVVPIPIEDIPFYSFGSINDIAATVKPFFGSAQVLCRRREIVILIFFFYFIIQTSLPTHLGDRIEILKEYYPKDMLKVDELYKQALAKRQQLQHEEKAAKASPSKLKKL